MLLAVGCLAALFVRAPATGQSSFEGQPKISSRSELIDRGSSVVGVPSDTSAVVNRGMAAKQSTGVSSQLPANGLAGSPGRARGNDGIPHVNDKTAWTMLLAESRAGVAEASLAISKLLRPLGKKWPESAAFQEFDGLLPDKLYWLRQAAAQGSVAAMNDFANEVFNAVAVFGNNSLLELPPQKIMELRREAVGMLNAAIGRRYIDSFVLASSLLARNSDGVLYDAPGSFSCLAFVARMGDVGSTINPLLARARARLRSAEIAEAERRLNSALPCMVRIQ